MSLRIPDIAGKAVMITGGSTGIGAALARAFAAQGAMVGVHYHASGEAAEAVAAGIEAGQGRVRLIRADAERPDEIRSAIKEMADAFGRIDGLVNNAGGMIRRVRWEDLTEADYEEITGINARSVAVACQAAIPHLKVAAAETGDAFIINTTSIAARNGGSAGAGPYGAAKGFVQTLTHGMAKELIGYGIRVNAVAPGVIATAFHDRYSTAAQLAAAVATIPAGRVGTAEECVGAYLFLASKAMAGYITGQVIEVNGGQLMP
ncbi:MAG: SDR family NAD(P)-dependent oxidoreductase [Paracoccaceae bacterium]